MQYKQPEHPHIANDVELIPVPQTTNNDFLAFKEGDLEQELETCSKERIEEATEENIEAGEKQQYKPKSGRPRKQKLQQPVTGDTFNFNPLGSFDIGNEGAQENDQDLVEARRTWNIGRLCSCSQAMTNESLVPLEGHKEELSPELR